jgi:trehalose-6-phosphate synthase
MTIILTIIKIATVVLSEFTGCARSLGGAMLVNPWDTSELAQRLFQALRPVESFEENDDDDLTLTRFSRADPVKSHATMLKYVMDFTSEHWVM